MSKDQKAVLLVFIPGFFPSKEAQQSSLVWLLRWNQQSISLWGRMWAFVQQKLVKWLNAACVAFKSFSFPGCFCSGPEGLWRRKWQSYNQELLRRGHWAKENCFEVVVFCLVILWMFGLPLVSHATFAFGQTTNWFPFLNIQYISVKSTHNTNSRMKNYLWKWTGEKERFRLDINLDPIGVNHWPA